MLEAIFPILTFIVGLITLIAILVYNIKLFKFKTHYSIDYKSLYTFNTIGICFGLFLIFTSIACLT